jgi:hypothetical protein
MHSVSPKGLLLSSIYGTPNPPLYLSLSLAVRVHALSLLPLFPCTGKSKQVFFAQFIYGADNGAHLDNQVRAHACCISP